jgi:hypothetical protein
LRDSGQSHLSSNFDRLKLVRLKGTRLLTF